MSKRIEVLGAYGRNYVDGAVMKTDWFGGLDFEIDSISPPKATGKYISIRDFKEGMIVTGTLLNGDLIQIQPLPA
jgi:hypothetical protein